MFLDLPLLARVPLQTIVWCWVVLLPGAVFGAAFLQRKRTSIATVGALTIGFGLAAVPALVHLYVLFAAQPTNIWALLLAATATNLFGLWKWRGGCVWRQRALEKRRPRAVPNPRIVPSLLGSRNTLPRAGISLGEGTATLIRPANSEAVPERRCQASALLRPISRQRYTNRTPCSRTL